MKNVKSLCFYILCSFLSGFIWFNMNKEYCIKKVGPDRFIRNMMFLKYVTISPLQKRQKKFGCFGFEFIKFGQKFVKIYKVHTSFGRGHLVKVAPPLRNPGMDKAVFCKWLGSVKFVKNIFLFTPEFFIRKYIKVFNGFFLFPFNLTTTKLYKFFLLRFIQLFFFQFPYYPHYH